MRPTFFFQVQFTRLELCSQSEHRKKNPGTRARAASDVGRQQRSTWIEEHDGPEAAQLRLIHLHLAHLGDELGEDAVEDGADAGVVRRAAVHVESRREQNSVLDRDRAVREPRDQELVPTCATTNTDVTSPAP